MGMDDGLECSAAVNNRILSGYWHSKITFDENFEVYVDQESKKFVKSCAV